MTILNRRNLLGALSGAGLVWRPVTRSQTASSCGRG